MSVIARNQHPQSARIVTGNQHAKRRITWRRAAIPRVPTPATPPGPEALAKSLNDPQSGCATRRHLAKHVL
jgi:hypothetical protein